MRRLGVALATGALAALVQPDAISRHTRLVVAWDVAALTCLALAWAFIARADAPITRDHALSADQSGYFIFLFVVGAACASIVAIGFVVVTIRDLAFWVSILYGARSATVNLLVAASRFSTSARSRSRKKLTKVRITAMAARRPISSQLGEKADSTISAAS